jgi:hypothetical protein
VLALFVNEGIHSTLADDLNAVNEFFAERRVGDVLVLVAVGLQLQLGLVTQAYDSGVERGADNYG